MFVSAVREREIIDNIWAFVLRSLGGTAERLERRVSLYIFFYIKYNGAIINTSNLAEPGRPLKPNAHTHTHGNKCASRERRGGDLVCVCVW